MLATGLKVIGVIASGTLLGAVLGSFADPVPREPDAWPTQLSARPEFSGAQSYQFVEVGPEDLSPPSPPALPDSFAPDWASDENEEVWQYPEPSLETRPFPSVAELDAQLAEDAAILDTGAESARIASSAADAAPAGSPAAPLAGSRPADLY